ncbi:MAG: OmpA family protein [Flavobacteriaceae bacterium]
MRNFLTAFLVFLFWSAFALWFHQTQSEQFCDECATSHITSPKKNSITEPKKEIVEEVIPKKSENLPVKTYEGFVIFDESNNPIYQFSENFITNSNNSEVIIPNSITSFKDSIYNFLNNNQLKELVIKAKHLNSETNFGTIRGNQIKNILTDFGVNPDKITVESVVSNYSYNSTDNTYNKGISMFFRDISKEKISDIENNIANKTLYSYFAQKGFKPDRTLQAYTIELKNYLNKYPNKKIIVTGHTDAVGSAEANEWFGSERAKNVVKYFVSQGIEKNKFTSLSKGQTEPIATNATSEGRAKNRRIEIKIQ